MATKILANGTRYHTGRISKAAELRLYGKGDGPILMTRSPAVPASEPEPEQEAPSQTSEPASDD